MARVAFSKWRRTMSAINWARLIGFRWSRFHCSVLIVARIGEKAVVWEPRTWRIAHQYLLFAAGFAVWSYALHDTLTLSDRHARARTPGLGETQRTGNCCSLGGGCPWFRTKRKWLQALVVVDRSGQ
jgi:hypothetical protein